MYSERFQRDLEKTFKKFDMRDKDTKENEKSESKSLMTMDRSTA